MESAGIGGILKNTQKFYCNFCDHIACQKSDFDRHCQTLKHQKAEKWNRQESAKNVQNDSLVLYYNCSCGRKFATQSGLWKHTRKCKDAVNEVSSIDIDKNEKKEKKEEIVSILLKQNEEYRNLLLQTTSQLEERSRDHFNIMLKKEEDFRALVIELCKNTQPNVQNNNNTMIQNNNNNCNNTTNNNTSFNLNFFLNETCKDAVNMSDFIKSIQVGFEDIERIGNIGYVDGISGIIIKSLQELGVEKRPIHCTDAKRQTLYIKENDEWMKEDADWSHLQHMVNEVQKINLRQLPAWREYHPNCLTSSSKFTTTYNTMSQELMGGDCKKVKMQVKDNKIMNRILKEVVIDKSLFVGEKF
jgi:hypothetical protein